MIIIYVLFFYKSIQNSYKQKIILQILQQQYAIIIIYDSYVFI